MLYIDCKYDSFIHKHSAVSVISGEGIQNTYPNQSREELFPLFQENSNGLTIITNGGKEFFYGRKDGKIKSFTPYKVDVKSTLGAGDSFKAGCTYALAMGMNDELVQFASACAAVAISRYPLQLDPPTVTEIEKMMNIR
ncbi:MAG: PfkB family carbohydrate kinase [Oscillospiraceae bacterium]